MLREVSTVSQPRGERRRRLFSGPGTDLYVFFNDDGSVFAIQFLYHLPREPWLAVFWSQAEGYSTFQVTSMEGGSAMWDQGLGLDPIPRHKISIDQTIAVLTENDDELDDVLRLRVREIIRGFPTPDPCPDCKPGRRPVAYCLHCQLSLCGECRSKRIHEPCRHAPPSSRPQGGCHFWDDQV
ncbi:MAG: hypothetical protein HY078_11055 [Elusimicrobia bacterium]|nr:hypothetical protein [Elusimicrobiota bacterium]